MDEWEHETVRNHRRISEPFLRIIDLKKHSESNRINLSLSAYKALGEPSHVQIMVNKKDSGKLKLVSSYEGLTGARPVRRRSSYCAMGGGSNLVKRYHMRTGYYILVGDGVFEWRYN